MLAAQFFQAPLAIAVLIYYTITTYCFRLKHVEYIKRAKKFSCFKKQKKKKKKNVQRKPRLQIKNGFG